MAPPDKPILPLRYGAKVNNFNPLFVEFRIDCLILQNFGLVLWVSLSCEICWGNDFSSRLYLKNVEHDLMFQVPTRNMVLSQSYLHATLYASVSMAIFELHVP